MTMEDSDIAERIDRALDTLVRESFIHEATIDKMTRLVEEHVYNRLLNEVTVLCNRTLERLRNEQQSSQSKQQQKSCSLKTLLQWAATHGYEDD